MEGYLWFIVVIFVWYIYGIFVFGMVFGIMSLWLDVYWLGEIIWCFLIILWMIMIYNIDYMIINWFILWWENKKVWLLSCWNFCFVGIYICEFFNVFCK